MTRRHPSAQAASEADAQAAQRPKPEDRCALRPAEEQP